MTSLTRLKLVLLVGSLWVFPSCSLQVGGADDDAATPNDAPADQGKGDAVTSNAIDSAAE